MSISDKLSLLQGDIQSARTAITTKGGTVTAGGGSSQLSSDIATIPSGPNYTRVKCIISDGDCWFDLGIYPTYTWTFYVQYLAKQVGVAQCIFGTRNDSSSTASDGNSAIIDKNNYLRRDYYGSTKNGTSAADSTISLRHTYVYRHVMRQFYASNSYSVTATSKTSGKSTNSLYLFAINTNGVATIPYKGNFYYMSIFEDSVTDLTHEYIPVLDANNIPCIYDTIDKTFIYNSGTGTLTYETL